MTAIGPIAVFWKCYLSGLFPGPGYPAESHRKFAIARHICTRTQGMKVMEILGAITAKNGKTPIVISYDVRIMKFADRIVRLEDGRIVQ